MFVCVFQPVSVCVGDVLVICGGSGQLEGEEGRPKGIGQSWMTLNRETKFLNSFFQN